jgi:opacity protein-like surface antigen
MKKFITSVLCFSVLSANVFAGMQSVSLRHLTDNRNPELKKNVFSTQSSELFQSHFFTNTNLFAKRKKGNDAFSEGAIVITAGYGFPNLGKMVVAFIFQNESDVSATGAGPVHFRGEYGLSDKVGIVASINYVSYGARWTTRDPQTNFPYDNKLIYSSISVLARLNFHFGVTEKLDPYFGVGAGYKSGQWTLTTNDPNLQDDKAKTFSPFGFETTIGLRYYFTDVFGIYTELGIAKSVIQGGLALKF